MSQKTYYVERIIMCGGGNAYHVYENGSWNTHSSGSTIEVAGKNKHVFRTNSLRPLWLNDKDYPSLSDERYNKVTKFYAELEELAKSICHEAFPETKDLNDPLPLWHHFESDLPATVVKVVRKN